MKVQLNKSLENINWFGCGPHESYQDRKTAAAVGVYKGKVWEQYHPYVRPQETGNKCDVRWLELKSENNKGIRIKGLPLFDANAQAFDTKLLNHKSSRDIRKHGNEISKGDVITLNIDLKQMGVGGDTSWGARTHPEYSISSEELHFTFYISPLQ